MCRSVARDILGESHLSAYGVSQLAESLARGRGGHFSATERHTSGMQARYECAGIGICRVSEQWASVDRAVTSF